MSRGLSPHTWCVLTLLLLPGCEPERAGAARGEVPAGVPTLEASRRLRIGAPDGSGDSVLGRVHRAILRGNRIYVLNGIGPEIREYDLAGALVRRIGRAGDGPGEFSRLRWIAPLQPDSLVALDADARRVTVFDPSGNYARSFPINPPAHGQPEWIAEFGDGFAVGFSTGVDPRTLDVRGIARDSLVVHFVAREPRLGDSTVQRSPQIGSRWWQRLETNGAKRVRAISDGPSALIASLGDTLVVSSGEGNAVHRWRNGRWERIELEGLAQDHGEVPGVAGVPRKRFTNLAVAAPGGDCWLADAQPEPAGRRRWYVFDSEGKLRSMVTLPEMFTVWQVEGTTVLGKLATDDGVEYVEVLELGGAKPAS